MTNIADIIRNFDVNTNDNLELWSTEHKDYVTLNDKHNETINHDNPLNKIYFYKTFIDIDELVRYMNDNESDYSLISFNKYGPCDEIVAIFKKC